MMAHRAERERRRGREPGVYQTEYGNAAAVFNRTALKAWDLDAGEWIPMELVTREYLRPIEPGDERD
jgi:hypothetical protein